MQILSQSLPKLPLPFDMIPIEGGIFDMGDEYGDLWEACRPVHKVKVSDFYIGKYPVTQALWRAVMTAASVGVTPSHPHTTLNPNPSRFQGDDRPVEQVSWDDITLKFLPALRKLTGLEYRLPTEAEWEYAARGGKYHTEGCKYAGSDRLKDVGWFDKNSGEETKPVGLKYPNQMGIYDMSGNVWEWCEDWYGSSEYYQECEKEGIVENPRGPEKGLFRVHRGGGWLRAAPRCRVAFRFHNEPDYRYNRLGFRLALSLH